MEKSHLGICQKCLKTVHIIFGLCSDCGYWIEISDDVKENKFTDCHFMASQSPDFPLWIGWPNPIMTQNYGGHE
jgi:hypothetical protein